VREGKIWRGAGLSRKGKEEGNGTDGLRKGKEPAFSLCGKASRKIPRSSSPGRVGREKETVETPRLETISAPKGSRRPPLQTFPLPPPPEGRRGRRWGGGCKSGKNLPSLPEEGRCKNPKGHSKKEGRKEGRISRGGKKMPSKRGTKEEEEKVRIAFRQSTKGKRGKGRLRLNLPKEGRCRRRESEPFEKGQGVPRFRDNSGKVRRGERGVLERGKGSLCSYRKSRGWYLREGKINTPEEKFPVRSRKKGGKKSCPVPEEKKRSRQGKPRPLPLSRPKGEKGKGKANVFLAENGASCEKPDLGGGGTPVLEEGDQPPHDPEEERAAAFSLGARKGTMNSARGGGRSSLSRLRQEKDPHRNAVMAGETDRWRQGKEEKLSCSWKEEKNSG